MAVRSLRESSTIIIYPQKSSAGAEIAHAAVALASKTADKKKKAVPRCRLKPRAFES